MAWTDRIREAAYNSPQGTRQTFDFEDVQRSVDKKTAAFDFADADGTYIQDNGHSGRQYPLRVFFWGDDHDLEADAFEALLLERGTGRLEHPRYGVVDVVPFGTITQRDDLKTAANQTIIEVSFWATTGIVYPTGQSDPASDVTDAVSEYNAAAADQFGSVVDTDTAIERVSLKNSFSVLLDAATSTLGGIAAAQDDVRQQFGTIADSIRAGIDDLVAIPSDLAAQAIILLQAPAQSIDAIATRLSTYAGLIDDLIDSDPAEPGYDAREANTYHAAELYASTYVTGSVLSVVNTQFETKSAALAAAEEILDQLAAVTAWRDDNYASLSEIDTGESYQKLLTAAALAAGFLVEISFSLKQERRITLDRARSIIDLAAELYGSVDDKLDFLIQSNSLTGSEILELPRGREIVYYV